MDERDEQRKQQDFISRTGEATGGGGSPLKDPRGHQVAYPTNQNQACDYRPNPRRLIEERVQRLNMEARSLMQLLRALPQEMNREAEEALADLLLRSNARY